MELRLAPIAETEIRDNGWKNMPELSDGRTKIFRRIEPILDSDLTRKNEYRLLIYGAPDHILGTLRPLKSVIN